MSEESEEFARWLASVVSPESPMPAKRPDWLEGAEVTFKADATTPGVRVRLTNGAEFSLMVLQMSPSYAQRAAYERRERERRRRMAEQTPEEREAIRRDQREQGDQLDRLARAMHEDKSHRAPFERCRDEMCDSFRDSIAALRGENYPADEDMLDDADGHVN